MDNTEKRQLANKLIEWIKAHSGFVSLSSPTWGWVDNSKMLDEAANDLEVQKFDLWKVYDLLRTLGRIELVNPNGRKGARLVNDTPIELPLIVSKRCDPIHCPVVKSVFKAFPELQGCGVGMALREANEYPRL